jgi:hypothetical protein
MGNYHESASHCRFSLFKPSGKWCSDHSVDMNGVYNEPLIHRAVWKAWQASRTPADRALEEGWILVILEPYHIHSHPIMLIGGRNYD